MSNTEEQSGTPVSFSIYGDGLDAWLVYNVGYHTCGGYGPESGYMHEPGCGQEPLIQMKAIQGLDEWISNYLDDDDDYYLVSRRMDE